MMEVVIATAVVGLMVAAALNAVGQSAQTALLTRERATGAWLADSLLAEMMDAPAFVDGVQGPEGGEVGDDRDKFDDVNDYHGWVGRPPVDMRGNALGVEDGYMRLAAVWGVKPTDPETPGTMADDARLLIVRVMKGNRIVAERWAVRTRAMEANR
jgi:hypothetical protein